MTLLWVALGGGVGAAARFVLDGVVARHAKGRFPLGTLLVNVTGSLLLGVLVGWTLHSAGSAVAADVRTVVGTGFCGGYTTFSTASVETVRLWGSEGPRDGLAYAAVTLVGSAAAAWLGLALGSVLG